MHRHASTRPSFNLLLQQQPHVEGSRGSQPALEENAEPAELSEDSARCHVATLPRCLALPNQIVGDEGLEPPTSTV